MAAAFDLGAMLGTTSEAAENQLRQIPCELLVPFEINGKKQCFKLYPDDKLQELTTSITENGVLNPLIVRATNNGKYMILAGHNRANAAKLAGLTTVPCRIVNCDDRTANLIMIDTNLNQREEISFSERAFAYLVRMENGTASEIAKKEHMDRRQIFRYIRLTYLIKDLLEKIDNKKITFVAGVNLSYISHKNQRFLVDYMLKNNISTVKPKQAERIKQYSNNAGDLDEFFLKRVFSKQPAQSKITFTTKDFETLLPGKSPEQIKEIIITLLKEATKERK